MQDAFYDIHHLIYFFCLKKCWLFLLVVVVVFVLFWFVVLCLLLFLFGFCFFSKTPIMIHCLAQDFSVQACVCSQSEVPGLPQCCFGDVSF